MRRLALLAVIPLTLLAACSGGALPAATGTPEATTPATATPEVTAPAPQTADAVVFAAASLNTVFPGIAAANYSFDGSSGLVDQLKGGAPADVFASADRKNMDKAVEAGLIDGDPVMFATNYLVLVTPADNPAGITGFDDSLDGVKLVVCAPDVPCGAATVKAAEANGIELRPVSEEAKVTDVLGKVTAGEADAGLVYATDAAGAGDKVVVFDVPGASDEPNTYWIGRVKGAPNPEQGDAFIAAVTGEQGQARLRASGFGAPR